MIDRNGSRSLQLCDYIGGFVDSLLPGRDEMLYRVISIKRDPTGFVDPTSLPFDNLALLSISSSL